MNILTFIFLAIVMVALFGGWLHTGAPFHYGGTGIITVLLVVLLVLVLTGRL